MMKKLLIGLVALGNFASYSHAGDLGECQTRASIFATMTNRFNDGPKGTYSPELSKINDDSYMFDVSLFPVNPETQSVTYKILVNRDDCSIKNVAVSREK